MSWGGAEMPSHVKCWTCMNALVWIPSTHKNILPGGVHLKPQYRGSRGRQIPRAHWPANLANKRAPGSIRD